MTPKRSVVYEIVIENMQAKQGRNWCGLAHDCYLSCESLLQKLYGFYGFTEPTLVHFPIRMCIGM